MPDTPERDIEKQLRASAEQRRAEAGAPFDLHEATRSLLQAEVVRQYGKPRGHPEASRSWWLAFWPRLALATPLVVLVVAGIVWLTSPPSTPTPALLAAATKKDSVEDSKVGTPSVVANATPSAPSPVSDKAVAPPATLAMTPLPDLKLEGSLELDAARAATSSAVTTGALAAAEASRPATGTAAPLEVASARAATRAQDRLDQGPGEFRGRGGFGGGGFGGGGRGGARGGLGSRTLTVTENLADSTQAAGQAGSTTLAMRATAESPARQLAATSTQAPALERRESQDTRQQAAANIWYFRNAAESPASRDAGSSGGRRAAASRAPAPAAAVVLKSFRFEQTGNDLRIVDEDGSVYAGRIQTPGDDSQKAPDSAALQDRLETRARLLEQAKSLPMLPQVMPVQFDVTGVNRSLSQELVFTGQLQQAVTPVTVINGQTNAIPLAANAVLKGTKPGASAASLQPAASNVVVQQRIVGRARLADSRELPVDALQIQR